MAGLTRNHSRSLAEINAKAIERCDKMRHPDESVSARGTVWHMIADQVRWLKQNSASFDTVKFIVASGVSEDWAIDLIIDWSKA
jgi:hypothetical protein